MLERPRTHSTENAEFVGVMYLENLGLHWEALRGKKVLDIGAGGAEFEHAARRRVVDVISVDNLKGEFAPPQDSRYVAADSGLLPFANDSFDYAFAHMSVTNYGAEDDSLEGYMRYLESALKEACRVLKSDGEFRFTDTRLEGSPAEEHRLVEELAKRAGFRELRLKKHKELSETQKDYNVSHYFVAIK
jgi:SAM-dependent methyltransferase